MPTLFGIYPPKTNLQVLKLKEGIWPYCVTGIYPPKTNLQVLKLKEGIWPYCVTVARLLSSGLPNTRFMLYLVIYTRTMPCRYGWLGNQDDYYSDIKKPGSFLIKTRPGRYLHKADIKRLAAEHLKIEERDIHVL